ncbi:ATP phosphoribosyltransferase [Albimonas sp. CAU 1670]|uniref:ATP phosphoribosyltransferase n=1 Tax=Albimonas sp. CAU 1670 TaxID=3032599 RepID=UPI0023DB68FF|nr:ATP phosphoribosyltransferase [Albimonas sp. CAU 1670]MDF2231543.1 ATP phosphoribosyltransferase [Albimonas sp. CAU 1670]
MSPSSTTSDRIILGLPSKGRLMDSARAWFADRGLHVVRSDSDREYAGRIEGVAGVDLALLSAGEIPRELAAGRIHLGVTGEDMVRERIPDADAAVRLLTPMGFGHADLMIAVPDAWADVETMDDLDAVAGRLRAQLGRPLRIATKYHLLVRRFLRANGVADCLLVDSQGATEGVVRQGTAEAIADITSSGATLTANRLRPLSDGVILRSQAQLCLSLAAPRSAAQVKTLDLLAERLGVPALASAVTR